MKISRLAIVIGMFLVLISCPCLGLFTDVLTAAELIVLDRSTADPPPTAVDSSGFLATQTTDPISDSDAATQMPGLPNQTTSLPNGSRTYSVHQTVELVNEGSENVSRIMIWLALIQTIEPYQQVDAFSATPADYETQTDAYGNRYAVIEFTDVPAGESLVVELDYTVTVNKMNYQLNSCSGTKHETDLDAERYIESDTAEIKMLADNLRQGMADDCETARAIYDYVGDELSYSQYTAQDLGALEALSVGSGDCTEFSDLFIALNRAAGIPARFLEGVTCCTENGYEAGENKHDWSEVFLPGNGWVPVDITWGRFPNKRNLYFAGMTPDHIIVTRGRNLDTLGGYHYYYYQYWWDNHPTSISSTENWSILLADQ